MNRQSLHEQSPLKYHDTFLCHAMAEARPVLQPWYDESRLCDHLTTELTHDLAAAPEAGVRLLELTHDRWITLHVPLGHDVGSPHKVYVRHRNFAIRTAQELQQLIHQVRNAIAPLDPNRVLVFFQGNPLPECAADHIVAGLIDALHLPQSAKIPPTMRLESPKSMDFYEQYRAWYEEFWRLRPHLKHDVRVESREDIEHCLDQNAVRLIYLGGELCGMLAAHQRTEFGLTGWRMRERVTAPNSWGKGISTAALVPFAQSLEHDKYDAIWGNIVPANESSLQSALRIGRHIVGTMCTA